MSGEFKTFVRNIPYDCNEEEFRNFMGTQDTTGSIVNVRLVVSNQNAETPRNKGYGFVTFNNEEVRNNFVANEQILFNGRRLKFVEYVNQQKYYKLHVGNIPETLSIHDLTNIFSKYGVLYSVKKDYNFKTKTFRGTAEVVYTNYEDFNKVIAMQEIPFVEGIAFSVAKRYRPTSRRNPRVPRYNQGPHGPRQQTRDSRNQALRVERQQAPRTERQ